jgi:hypothetical protein
MPKMLAAAAALGLAAMIALPGPAAAKDTRAPGARPADQIDISARKRHTRHHARRYWRHHRHYYGGGPYYEPYYAYGYPDRYYRPGPYIGFGPFGFGFGFGW